MIKKEVISFVRNLLPKEDKVGKWHERFLVATIEKVLSEMYADLHAINPRLLDNYVKTYGATTPIAISLEASSGIYYSTIPVTICNLPSKNSGLRHIYPAVQTGNQFQPMDAREADLIFNTDVAVVTSKIGFRVRQDSRVDYWNTNAVVRAAGVRMDLLPTFSAYRDTDVVNIPELTEKQGGTFAQRVLTLLGVVQPSDLLDNNAENRQQTNSKR